MSQRNGSTVKVSTAVPAGNSRSMILPVIPPPVNRSFSQPFSMKPVRGINPVINNNSHNNTNNSNNNKHQKITKIIQNTQQINIINNSQTQIQNHSSKHRQNTSLTLRPPILPVNRIITFNRTNVGCVCVSVCLSVCVCVFISFFFFFFFFFFSFLRFCYMDFFIF